MIRNHLPHDPLKWVVARPAFNGKQTMPRNRTTKSSTVVQLRNEIRQIKAETNPSIRTYRPAIQPSPIKSNQDSRWSYARFRMSKDVASTGAIVSFSSADVVAAVGIPKIDFQIDRLSCWLLGPPEFQKSSITWESFPNLLPTQYAFKVSDFGTMMKPPAIGIDLPRVFTEVTTNATSATTSTQFNITVSSASASGQNASLVVDFWALYRSSA